MTPEDLAALHEGVNEIFDLVEAYRAAANARGFSPTAAEQMALEYHAMILRNMPPPPPARLT